MTIAARLPKPKAVGLPSGSAIVGGWHTRPAQRRWVAQRQPSLFGMCKASLTVRATLKGPQRKASGRCPRQ